MDTTPNATMTVLRRAQHVLFAVLVIVAAVRTAQSGSPWVGALGGAGLIAWYALGPLTKARMWWLGVLVAGWIALSVYGADWVWVAFPLFFLCLRVLPTPVGQVAVGALTLFAAAGFMWHRGSLDVAALVGPVIGAAVAIVMTAVYDTMRADAAARAELLQELLAAQKELRESERRAGAVGERERLAREIHDTITQGLTSIVFLLQAGGRTHLSTALSTAQSSLEESRRLIAALAPAELNGRPLADALKRVADDSMRVGLDTALVVDGTPYRLPTSTEVALLRVAQGALANVRVHARASHARVTLTYQPDKVRLDVADDGHGFDPHEPPVGKGSGIGLSSMRGRLGEVGGILVVESTPGEGSALSAIVPATEVPA
ncbi:Signal transduction histidine kinase [Actinokineospora alba]|uniref:Oxygen sensor histidine kinase NreB n=1 Tax=Actinokineospora alba TaxID=504798 RepID=A0A1H0R3Q9_9PSEU|nr:sensor histidine kinase [Actinokineospora alba]TDP70262.1 signal transduction histidine kinase [Actinokineospora alba]SDI35494.1 Signal transduction histidine kinase [Actinokineospora alba]SDP24162.1 Signal transduction histidine kinase [Actinokineospora alba]